MTLEEIIGDGFRVIQIIQRPADERGVDGCLVLRKTNPNGVMIAGKKAQKFWVAAHYAKQNIYGIPVPVPV